MSLILKIISLICLSLIMVIGFALPSDNQETVFTVSDSAVYNYKTGRNVFTGHVKVDQGTTHITADRLITKNNNEHKIVEAIAYGDTTPAHYWTLPKEGDPEVHAIAKIIKFYPTESNVTLEKDVVVTQGENRFHGQLVLYNRNDQTITVPPSANSRAVLVYKPDK